MSQLRDDVEYTSDWVREPQGRGTLSILYTCTFTLVLCVYTAIHLNIPPAGEPRRWQIMRKIKWMFVAIFAPEAVLFTAIYQFWSAWTFCREMDRVRADLGGGVAVSKKSWWNRRPSCFKSRNEEDGATPVDTSNPQPPEPFSITYGFYVIMGGLTVDVSDMHNYIKTVTLSPSYVLETTRTLEDWKRFAVSDTTIQDKSKADTLAKSLVVLQVSWLFLQCITRASQGRPLTILEVHTLAHAFCAMLMYGLWFNKPLDIRDTTVVESSGFTNNLASELMRMPDSMNLKSGSTGLHVGSRMNKDKTLKLSLLSFLGLNPVPRLSSTPVYYLRETLIVTLTKSLLQMEHVELHLSEQDYEVFSPAELIADETGNSAPGTTHMEPTCQPGTNYVCTLLPGQSLRCGWQLDPHVRIHNMWDVISYSLTAKDVLRWKRAANERIESLSRGPAPRSRQRDLLKTGLSVSMRSKNFQKPFSEVREKENPAYFLYILGLGVIATVYGGVHLALWTFTFPSHVEMLLWKISGCTMAAPLVFGITSHAILLVTEADWCPRWLEYVFGYLTAFSLGGFIILYIFARVFTVVESFLAMRMVPVGVYEGITWADYIPHL